MDLPTTLSTFILSTFNLHITIPHNFNVHPHLPCKNNPWSVAQRCAPLYSSPSLTQPFRILIARIVQRSPFSETSLPMFYATKRSNSKSPDIINGQTKKATALCSVEPEAIGDFQLRKALKPLLNLGKKKKTCNPHNFSGAPMVTTFVRSVGDRTKGIRRFLKTACRTDTGIELAELEHPLKRCLLFCSGGGGLHLGSPLFLQVAKGAVPA